MTWQTSGYSEATSHTLPFERTGGARRWKWSAYVGSTDRVCAFDGTGATLLQIPMGNSTESSPAVVTIGGKRRLFVSSLDGALYSFAANTGRLLWKLQTGGPVHSSPAIDGGRVYVGSEDGHLYAVAADDGATPAVLTNSHYSAGGVVFFTNGAAQNPQLLSADPTTGALGTCSVFRGGTSPRFATLAIGHGIVYFQSRERLYARNATHCTSRIERVNIDFAYYPVGDSGFTAPAFANGIA